MIGPVISEKKILMGVDGRTTSKMQHSKTADVCIMSVVSTNKGRIKISVFLVNIQKK